MAIGRASEWGSSGGGNVLVLDTGGMEMGIFILL